LACLSSKVWGGRNRIGGKREEGPVPDVDRAQASTMIRFNSTSTESKMSHQFQFDPSTPPPPPPPPLPPPKPAYSSGQATPSAGPPRPPPPLPPGQSTPDGQHRYSGLYQTGNGTPASVASIPPPEHGWLPDVVKDKTFVEFYMCNDTIF
jgi:hypothetical protein